MESLKGLNIAICPCGNIMEVIAGDIDLSQKDVYGNLITL